MKTLITLLLPLPMLAQTAQVPCKASILSSANMRTEYGGKVTLYKAPIVCENKMAVQMPQQGSYSGVDIELALPTTNTLSSADAKILLGVTYNNQWPVKAQHDLSLGLGGIGTLVALIKGVMSASTLGTVVSIVTGVTQYFLPHFTDNTPPFDVGSPCGDITSMILPPAGVIRCNAFIQTPPKSAPPLISTLMFDLAAPITINGTQPPAPPVRLRQPITTPQHNTQIDPDYVPHPDGYWRVSNPTTLVAKGK